METLINGAYAAAVDDERWQAWAELAVRQFGGAGGLLCSIDRKTRRVSDALPVHSDAPRSGTGFEEYMQEMRFYDPQVKHSARVDRCGLYTSHNLSGLQTSDDTKYNAWQEDRFGFRSHVSLVAPVTAFTNVVLSVHFSRNTPDLTSSKLDQLRRLAAPFSHAVRLGYRHAAVLSEEYWQGSLAAHDRVAVFLIDRRGQVLRHNEQAEKLTRSTDVVKIIAGKLECSNASEARLLDAVVGQAAAGNSSEVSAMLVRGRHGTSRLAI